MFGITKNVPVPEKAAKVVRSSERKYPFNEMKSGDSFFVPKSEMQEADDAAKFRGRIVKSAGNWARSNVESRGKRETFTIVLMDHTHVPQNDHDDPIYNEGDVGVWMD